MIRTFEDAGALGKELLDTGLASAAGLSKGAQVIAAEAAEFSRSSIAQGTAALGELIASPTLDRAFEVQTTYARSSYEALVAESTKFSGLFADMARDALKPFESALPKFL